MLSNVHAYVMWAYANHGALDCLGMLQNELKNELTNYKINYMLYKS